MRFKLLFVAALLVQGATALAQGPMNAPPYQRLRMGSPQMPAGSWSAGRRGGGYGGYGGYYNPYFASYPIVTGTWYQRPYPYHFDYYKYRWGTTPPMVAPAETEMIPASDCPCLTPQPAAGDASPVAPMPAAPEHVSV